MARDRFATVVLFSFVAFAIGMAMSRPSIGQAPNAKVRRTLADKLEEVLQGSELSTYSSSNLKVVEVGQDYIVYESKSASRKTIVPFSEIRAVDVSMDGKCTLFGGDIVSLGATDSSAIKDVLSTLKSPLSIELKHAQLPGGNHLDKSTGTIKHTK